MNKVTRYITLLPALAATLLLWGCEAAEAPIQPRLNPGGESVMSTGGTRYTVAIEKSPNASSVRETFGPEGGKLVLGKHQLLVGKNAVSAPTTFVMTRNLENPLRVKVTATRVTENDVGRAGFGAPVTLKLSYDNASDLPGDLKQIRVVYFRPDGLVEALPSNLNVSGHTVEADLAHFSLFGLAWP